MIGSFCTIPHKEQRYDTAGDYIDLAGGKIRHYFISELGNEDYEFMVLIHELIEHHLCLKRGIKEPDIMKFDVEYSGEFEDNPGCDPAAPYHKEHMFSEMIETLLAKELGVDSAEYDKSFEKLDYGR